MAWIKDASVNLKGKQMRDEELMEDALQKFQSEARSKFLKGILEHNPDGTKGLSRMHLLSKDRCVAKRRSSTCGFTSMRWNKTFVKGDND